MIHDAVRIVTDSHERSSLLQATTTSESQHNSTIASIASPSRTRRAPSIFGQTSLSPSRVWSCSWIVLKASSVLLLASWSTIVLSFRFATTATPFLAPTFLGASTNTERTPHPPGTAVQQPARLRGNEKSALSAATTDFVHNGQAPTDNGPMKLSLWLVPPGSETESDENDYDGETNSSLGSGRSSETNNNNRDSVYGRTQKVIDDLSAEWGGPRFIPHITLGGARVASENEALALAEKLSIGLSGFGSVECSFGETVLSAQDAWNQALVMELVPPFEQFSSLCMASRKILNMKPTNNNDDDCLTFPPPLRVPHMSLYYGDSPPPPDENYLSKVFGSSSSRSDKKSFRAHRVMLWKTDPSSLEGVSEWEPVSDISLV